VDGAVVDKPKSWYALATPDDGPAEVMIYDDIGMFGITAADFVRDIATIKADAITIRINSYGGDVFEGIAILNSIRGLDAATTVVVDGIAASIASVIAMGGDKVVMNQNSQMMIHNAWNFAAGNADELQRVADSLRSMSGNISTIYAAKAGGTTEEWQALMAAETWYTAEEAVAAGLADEAIVETVKNLPLAGVARASASLMHFKYPGREAAPAPQIAARAQTPPVVEAEKEKEPNMGTLSESALQKLGLDADADEAAIEAAIAALPEDGDTEPPEPPELTAEDVSKAAAKLGLTVVDGAKAMAVDKTAYDQLVVQARDGAEARAQQVREQDDATIRGALASGRITPASEAEWRKSLASNREGTKSLIATLPENKALAVDEIGHGVDSEGSPVEADKAFAFAQITGHDYGKGV
jgi:ATP-dependent protease ClpP protease subunit